MHDENVIYNMTTWNKIVLPFVERPSRWNGSQVTSRSVSDHIWKQSPYQQGHITEKREYTAFYRSPEAELHHCQKRQVNTIHLRVTSSTWSTRDITMTTTSTLLAQPGRISHHISQRRWRWWERRHMAFRVAVSSQWGKSIRSTLKLSGKSNRKYTFRTNSTS
jgi:hypothetical protein